MPVVRKEELGIERPNRKQGGALKPVFLSGLLKVRGGNGPRGNSNNLSVCQNGNKKGNGLGGVGRLLVGHKRTFL